MVEIKVCQNQLIHGTDQDIEPLQQDEANADMDMNIDGEACLGLCGECTNGPFVLIDDELKK